MAFRAAARWSRELKDIRALRAGRVPGKPGGGASRPGEPGREPRRRPQAQRPWALVNSTATAPSWTVPP